MQDRPDGATLQRKLQLLVKEYDTAYTSYARHSSQIVSIRGWTITLLLAYFGFLSASASRHSVAVVSMPALLILGGAFLLEAIEKLYARFNIESILEIQQHFSRDADEEFHNWVASYPFRDQMISRLRMGQKLRLLWRAGAGLHMLLWYSFLVVLYVGMSLTLRP